MDKVRVSVLIVEDDKDARETLRDMFVDEFEGDTSIEFSVLEASSVREARTFFDKYRRWIIVVVMDETVKDGNTCSFVTEMKKQSPGLFLIAASHCHQGRKRLVKAGCTHCISQLKSEAVAIAIPLIRAKVAAMAFHAGEF